MVVVSEKDIGGMGKTGLAQCVIYVAGLLLVMSVHAADGQLEINQACAVNTGCFAGDEAGFPVTIAQSGSYRLTSNLSQSGFTLPGRTVVPNDAIVLGANDVLLDLGGFTISCSNPFGGSCSGDANGITPSPSTLQGHVVENGIVTGMPERGIHVGAMSIVRDVVVRNVGNQGIRGESTSIIEDSIVYDSGSEGVFVGPSSIVRNNTIRKVVNGVLAGDGSIVRDNAVRAAVFSGVVCQGDVEVVANNLREVGTFGATDAALSSGRPVARNNSIQSGNDALSDDVLDLGGNVCNGSTACP